MSTRLATALWLRTARISSGRRVTSQGSHGRVTGMTLTRQFSMTATRSYPAVTAALRNTMYKHSGIALPSSMLSLRQFHATATPNKEYLLADIGRVLPSCNRFVKPGSVISQFDKICEVQSDKATVEITSRYDGTVKKLHYNVGDMAQDVADMETVPTDVTSSATTPSHSTNSTTISSKLECISSAANANIHAQLATPAVRRVAREHNIDLSNVKELEKPVVFSRKMYFVSYHQARHLPVDTANDRFATPPTLTQATSPT
ncbi:hypothetical protein BDF22DRAFT_744531 [Syncephalis plumigaleata]|nr:hypothetical protein BDF22DRAFT_744531 [Syncephalis plumigaleata]